MASISKPQCSANFWSSPAITATFRSSEIFSHGSQSRCRSMGWPSNQDSTLRSTISAVNGGGTKRKIKTSTRLATANQSRPSATRRTAKGSQEMAWPNPLSGPLYRPRAIERFLTGVTDASNLSHAGRFLRIYRCGPWSVRRSWPEEPPESRIPGDLSYRRAVSADSRLGDFRRRGAGHPDSGPAGDLRGHLVHPGHPAVLRQSVSADSDRCQQARDHYPDRRPVLSDWLVHSGLDRLASGPGYVVRQS